MRRANMDIDNFIPDLFDKIQHVFLGLYRGMHYIERKKSPGIYVLFFDSSQNNL